MRAKVPPKRGDSKSSFGTLGKYISGDRIDAETGELTRQDVPTETNCLSKKTAAAEMRAAAAMNGRVKDPVYHVVVSWPADEQPTDAQAFAAGRAAIKSVGMEGHQYLLAVHRDTDNVHVHVMVNRVNLETEKAVYPDRDWYKLDRTMREVEIEQGWRHDTGTSQVIERDGHKVVQRSKSDQGWQEKAATKARDFEHQTGLESLTSYAQGAPKQAVVKALKAPNANWQDLHATLAKHGLELREKGQGLAIYDKADPARTPLKASDMSELLGKGKLEKRLGAYEPPVRAVQIQDAERSYSSHRELKRNPEQRDERREQRAQARSELRAEYDKQRAEFKPANTVSQARGQQKEKQKAVSAAHVAERKHIRQSGLPPEVQKAMLSEAALKAAKEREAIKMRADAESAAIKSDPANKPQSYRDWVGDRAEQGDPAALSQLRGFVYADKRKLKELEEAERKRENEDGLTIPAPAPRTEPTPPRRVMDNISTQLDRRTGDVHYHLDRREVFTDHGPRLTFKADGSKDKDAVAAGLMVAREKFAGQPLTVTGSPEFKQRVLEVVKERNLQVHFADPEMERQRIQQERTRSTTRKPGIER